jgi:hypothetical protein
MNLKKNVAIIATFTILFGAWRTAAASVPSHGNNAAIKHQSLLIAALDCKEWKKRNGDKGKDAATNAPSWVKNEGHKPCKNPNEDGKTFAKRVLEGKYGPGNYPVGAGSEYSETQKYGCIP